MDEIKRWVRRSIGLADTDHAPEVDAMVAAMFADGYRNKWIIANLIRARLGL